MFEGFDLHCAWEDEFDVTKSVRVPVSNKSGLYCTDVSPAMPNPLAFFDCFSTRRNTQVSPEPSRSTQRLFTSLSRLLSWAYSCFHSSCKPSSSLVYRTGSTKDFRSFRPLRQVAIMVAVRKIPDHVTRTAGKMSHSHRTSMWTTSTHAVPAYRSCSSSRKKPLVVILLVMLFASLAHHFGMSFAWT